MTASIEIKSARGYRKFLAVTNDTITIRVEDGEIISVAHEPHTQPRNTHPDESR
jgi:hypothetical protein